MSLAEQLSQLTTHPGADEQKPEETSQLRDLAEVEVTLEKIGITLKPRFNISLAARIGATYSDVIS